MTTETINDPIEKEDKLTVFVPDALPKRLAAKKHEGETQEEFLARLEHLGLVTSAVPVVGAKSLRR